MFKSIGKKINTIYAQTASLSGPMHEVGGVLLLSWHVDLKNAIALTGVVLN